jgi:C-terminal processing protease CtpA/Prc
MQVIPFPRTFKRSAVSLLAATLVAGTVMGAEPVERDDAAAPTPAPPAPQAAPAPPAAAMDRMQADRERTQAERDRDARLEDAKSRLEKAAAEVAALSSEMANEAMQNFSVGRRRSIIGVQIEQADSGAGARVREVSPGGAAEAAGMKVGDVIVAVNGVTIKDGAREVVRTLRKVEPETPVKIRALRDGKPKDFVVTARRFDSPGFVFRTDPDFDFNFDFDPSTLPFGAFGPSAVSGGLAGMQLTSLTPQLARYFGTDKGLLVLRAPKDDVYKLQDGDVILNIDGRVPTSGSHVTRILRSYQPGETLTMRIMRDHKPMDLQITLPAPEHRGRSTRAAWSGGDSATL